MCVISHTPVYTSLRRHSRRRGTSASRAFRPRGALADDDLLTLTHTDPQPLTFSFGRNLSGQITMLTASDGGFLSRPLATQAVLRRYVYGPGIDERIALLDAACAGGRCYYLSNWQGSTTTLVNQTGSGFISGVRIRFDEGELTVLPGDPLDFCA